MKLLLTCILVACSAVSPLQGQAPPSPPKVGTPPAQAPATPVQPPPAAVQPPRPADPFVRESGAQKSANPPGVPNAALPAINLFTTVETWSLSQADYAALLDGSPHERAPYDRLEELAKAGKAKLIGLIALNNKSGQRAVVESIDELRYATKYSPSERAGEIAFPTSGETRNTGDTLELEPVIGPDGRTIDVNLVTQSVRFEGFKEWQPEATAAATVQPDFRTEKVTTSIQVQSGRPVLLATATPTHVPEEKGGRQVRVRALRVTAQPAKPSAPIADKLSDLRVEFLLYAMDREATQRILNDSPDSAQSHAAVRELLGKGEAQLETVSSLVTRSGQRAVNEEIFEIRYPTEMNPPAWSTPANSPPVRRPASATAFETRNAGVTLEIEPVLGPEGRIVDIDRQSGRLHDQVPDSTLHALEGIGHMVHHSAPAEVVAAIEEALRASGSRPSQSGQTLAHVADPVP